MRLDPLSPYRPSQLSWFGAARFEQGRYGEAVPLLREAAQLRPEAPSSHVLLAACYGQLSEAGLARQALDRYGALTPASLGSYADRTFRLAAHHKSFLDGVAAAGSATSSTVSV